MSHATLSLFVSVGLAVGTIASNCSIADTSQVPVPCIDTNDTSQVLLQIVRANQPIEEAQAAIGSLESWDPRTRTVGFKAAYSDAIEKIPVKSIHFSRLKPDMTAQVAVPRVNSLGNISRTYAASDFDISRGIARFPGCVTASDNHTFVFVGTISFSGNYVHVEGEVSEVIPPHSDVTSDHERVKGA
jgi:hypothetical protein